MLGRWLGGELTSEEDNLSSDLVGELKSKMRNEKIFNLREERLYYLKREKVFGGGGIRGVGPYYRKGVATGEVVY